VALTIPIVTVWPMPNGFSDRKNDISDFKLVAICKRDRRQILCLDLEHRDI